jgi:hypothetical protein
MADTIKKSKPVIEAENLDASKVSTPMKQPPESNL